MSLLNEELKLLKNYLLMRLFKVPFNSGVDTFIREKVIVVEGDFPFSGSFFTFVNKNTHSEVHQMNENLVVDAVDFGFGGLE